MKIVRSAAALFLTAAAASGQMYFGCICSTDVPYATGINNSHKLAARFELVGAPGDTVTLVFQSSQGIYTCLGVFSMDVMTWTEPVLLYPGQNPGIDFGGDGDRHLVWQFPDTSSPGDEVFYRNLEYRMIPVNVSETWGDSRHPDVWAGEDGLAHVVWEDYAEGKPRILYRTCNENGNVGGKFEVSVDTNAYCFQPAITRFGTDITVIWQQVDTACWTPYSIMRRRQTGDAWLDVETLAQHYRPLQDPSLDIGNEWEVFSAAWEDSSSGNSEAHFEGGNGGGYPTPGASTRPVVATLGEVWSYLFWQEDSAGIADIYGHSYYFGWYDQYSLRERLSISEPVFHPNCLGAVLVWTQGDAPPHAVMYAYFDYPIGVAEQAADAEQIVTVQPNPMRDRTVIRLTGYAGQPVEVGITDVVGRKVWSWRGAGSEVIWAGRDAAGRLVQSGIYFVRVETGSEEAVLGLVKY